MTAVAMSSLLRSNRAQTAVATVSGVTLAIELGGLEPAWYAATQPRQFITSKPTGVVE
jgi:hypothetical protein